MGLNVIQGARLAGAGMLIAIGTNQTRLDMAQYYGATYLLLADRADKGLLKADETVQAMTSGRDDGLIDHNRALHSALTDAGISHQYEEFAGGHEWAYWAEHLTDTLFFFDTIR